MKTRIYVDGYNLYYGCLKNTPYKWLDIARLIEDYILPTSIPADYGLQTVDIRYFTAPISGKAAQDNNSVKDQSNYHRALEALYDAEKLRIINGYFSITDTFAYKVDNENPSLDPRYCERVKVWKLEEKQTDVNIAVEAMYDALTDNALEHIVFVTNDTDIAPVLQKIKQTRDIKIGVIVPTKEIVRRPSEKLTSAADWFRSNIKNEELARAEMPRAISKSVRQPLRKPILKPLDWYGQSIMLKSIFEILLPVMNGKRNRCWQWLESQKPVVANLPDLHMRPIDMLNNEEDAKKVLLHAEAYAAYIIKDGK